MKKEEMAKAYAEGFAKEYREIAYDAFLCGYGAKCSTETSKELNDVAEEYRKVHTDEVTVSDGYHNDHTKEVFDVTPGEAFIAGAKWQAEQDKETIELAEDHAYLAGAVNEREKMMKEAVEGKIAERRRGKLYARCQVPKTMKVEFCDKVRVIIVKED